MIALKSVGAQRHWSRRSRTSMLAAVAASLVVSVLSPAQPAPSSTPDDTAPGEVVTLPKVTVEGESAKNYPFFKKTEVDPPGFSATSIPIDLFYPGKAYVDGVSEGSATVGVMLDSDGKPTDFLILRYTQRYFGESLLREAHEQQFAPRKVKGIAVHGRFDFGYRFVPTVVMQLTSFSAIEERNNEIEGGPRFIYAPHLEREIDGGALEGTKSSVAFFPDGYTPPPGKVVKVLVSFYVDESGHVRLPSVESAASPLLIPNAIKAIEHWEFRPPTLKGRPVLVFTTWSVRFVAFDTQQQAAPETKR